MRRTVNDARAPSPRRRMTMPSKSCVRSFSPSTTLTSTRTVSPGPNPSRSFLICPASTKRIASMTSSLSLGCGGVDLLRRLPTLESFDEPPLVGCQIRVLQEVRPGPPRDPERLHPPPPRDPRVIPGAEHRRDAGATELLGPCVLRRLEQAARERLALCRPLGAEHPGEEPRDRVGHHQRRQLAARQHVVADRDEVVGEPLTHPASTPSYRPARRIRCVSRASSAATACVNVRPRGSIRMTRAPGVESASTAANSGSGLSTMPPPPPNW